MSLNRLIKIIFCLLAGILALIVAFILFRYQHASVRRPVDRYAGNIEQVCSSVDADGDGIDDQTDILENALRYAATRPKYKSKYYENGYPDDGFGVCTDLVAFALRDAGYDLMQLVSEDIRANGSGYDVDAPDANIDFRRVRNLRVYLEGHAVKLTTDKKDIEAWQGGDIIVFENHIGIVSDRRNAEGLPYIIHHNDPWQTAYEQDILGSRDDITGHYRISE